MKVDIQSIHIEEDPQTREYLQKKLKKFFSYYEWISQGTVFLKKDKNDKKKDKVVEIKLMIPKSTVYAEARAEDFKTACDEAIAAARKQLRKYKTKVYHPSV